VDEAIHDPARPIITGGPELTAINGLLVIAHPSASSGKCFVKRNPDTHSTVVGSAKRVGDGL
jgi:hypothetical protein